MLIDNLTEIIGNTPTIRIDKSIHKLENIEVFAKLEYLNPFGSIKDRTAFEMLINEIEQIKNSKSIVIETSSGNTAKAIQCICGIYGIDFTTVTNRIKVDESKHILNFIGTKIKEIASNKNGVDEIKRIINISPNKYFHTSQYDNKNNYLAHKKTAQEIYNDIGCVDYFFHVLGTSGSSKGISDFLKEKNSNMQNYGVVTSNGSYIPGIRTQQELEECGFFSFNNYHKIITVDANTAKEYSKLLCRRSGILAGISSGASFCALISKLKEIDHTLTTKQRALFVVCDRIETYANFIKNNRFHKYHVLGNTYTVIDPSNISFELNKENISIICNKEYGIGSDGIIVAQLDNKNEHNLFNYRAYNSNGSEIDNAVFGSIIYAKYLIDSNIVQSKELEVNIKKTKMKVFFSDIDNTNSQIYLDFCSKITPIKIIDNSGFLVDIGNLNIVFESDNISKEYVEYIGEKLNIHPQFKDGINVQVVRIIDKNNIFIEAYERGVGYTLASGTSIISVCLTYESELDKIVNVHTPGGICTFNFQKKRLFTNVFKICEGEITNSLIE